MFLTIIMPTTMSSYGDIHFRHFSVSSTILKQNEDSTPKYLIAGRNISVADVEEMEAKTRTVAHWQLLVDWELQSQRPYVIIDPYDPRGLLYLSRAEYLLQSRVSLQNELILIVVARPGDKAPSPITKNSPPREREFISSTKFFQNRLNRLSWKEFKRLRHFAAINVKLVDGMVSVSPNTIERAVMVWAIQLFHYHGVTAPGRRLSNLFSLTRAMRRTLQASGSTFFIKRMKIALFAIYCYLSGNPLVTTDALGMRVRLSNGLPRMIPREYRALIRDGNMRWIRIWVSIFNIYRAFNSKLPDPNTAYATIRKPLPDLTSNELFSKFCVFARYVFPRLVEEQARRNGRILRPFKYQSQLGLIIRTAAANLRSSLSLFSIILDAKAWAQRGDKNYALEWFTLNKDEAAVALLDSIWLEDHYPSDPDLFDRVRDYCPVPDAKAAKQRLTELTNLLYAEGSLSGLITSCWKWAKEVRFPDFPIVGRLFNFGAPGGKLRTVAICDYWTQVALKPVHDYLFELLRHLKGNDATFDQQGTVDAYWAKNYAPHWSYDLSAATDSIPASLYVEVMAPFFAEGGNYDSGRAKADLWIKLLTDREFGLPSPRKGEEGYNGVDQYRTIQYTTGQPMGAYSSWASMALVHHALVQFSYWVKEQDMYNSKWFDTYLVLGDDVDIAQCVETALSYTNTCKTFEVKIGLHKSLQSNSNFFEFANQRFGPLGNLSPLSFLEEITSRTWNSRVEFAHRISKRLGIVASPTSLFRWVTSARQWMFLLPEFSGKRSPTFIRFLRFILLGPLSANWHTENTISLASITQWLQNLNKGLLEPVMEHEDLVRMDFLLCKAILSKVEKMYEREALALKTKPLTPRSGHSGPPMGLFPLFGGALPNLLPNLEMLGFHPSYLGKVVDQVQQSLHSRCYLQAVTELILPHRLETLRNYFNMFDTEIVQVPARAPNAYLYILSCVYKHNEEVRQRWIEVRTELRRLQKEMEARDVPYQMFSALVKTPSPLAQIVDLFQKASSLPVVIDPSSGINPGMFGVKPAVKPQDVAHVLLNEITPIVAQWTGVAVTNLPILPVGGRGLNPRDFRAFTKFYLEMKVDRTVVRHSVSAMPKIMLEKDLPDLKPFPGLEAFGFPKPPEPGPALNPFPFPIKFGSS